MIFYKGQVWRLLTHFLFFGLFSLDFLFHLYFLVRYCWNLEDSARFRGRTGDFLWVLLLAGSFMTAIAPFLSTVHFLGSSLTFMMVYVWGRLHPNQRMSFLGLFPFTAPYLPWVLLGFSLLLGNPIIVDAIGIAVGHTYYFFEFVFPTIAELRGWRLRRIITTPALLSHFNINNDDNRIHWEN